MSFVETALSYFQDFTSVFLEEGETSAEEALSVAVTLSIVAVPLWLITLPKWLIKIWGTYLIMLKKGKFSDDYEDYPDYEWPPQATTTAPSVNGSMNATEMSLGVDGDVTTTMPELATYIPPEAVYNETEFMVRVEPQGVQYILCIGSVISPRDELSR
ncbi:unnamed protein product [Notodromas monacha]|uniref:Uncharacterized protein n=1 Tax=Notodromas monacha TaxID=399045 RepID=A0A7R9BW70_9CRUS|nr:unnamed protein product [Notodromas monacha]CAG0922916.1 unnamed protein product [Notodromas monacha]